MAQYSTLNDRLKYYVVLLSAFCISGFAPMISIKYGLKMFEKVTYMCI